MNERDYELIELVFRLAAEGIRNNWLEDVDSTKWFDYVKILPPRLQATYLVGVLNMQVTNGGLNQYFVNGYGQFCYETIESLKMIGAEKASMVLEKASNDVNNEMMSPSKFRRKLIKGEIDRLYDDTLLDKALDNYDEQLLEYQAEIEEMLLSFIKNV